MGDGSVRKVHANKVHRFVARVQGCGVIADKDVEFGSVLTPVPIVTSVLPSRRVDQDKLAYLDVSESAQLCQLLDEFADCFVDMQAGSMRRGHTPDPDHAGVRAATSSSVSCADCVQGGS